MNTTLRAPSNCLFCLVLAALAAVRDSIAAEPADRTPVEAVTQKPRYSKAGLGTVAYKPSEAEQRFFDKLDKAERTTGGLAGDYELAGHAGADVGWFGIIREIKEDEAARETTLLVEHKYFDGLTDAHLQALSFNGGGDFRVVLHGVELGVPPLTLVKVYGKVRKAAAGDLPIVDAGFVRNWHWGTFTFLAAHGKQVGSEKWRKLNQTQLDDIYEPYPDDVYYEQRLGKRPDQAQRRQSLRRLALAAAKELELPPGSLPFTADDDERQPAAYYNSEAFRKRAAAAAEQAQPKSTEAVQALIDALEVGDDLEDAFQAAIEKENEEAAYAVLATALQSDNVNGRIAASARLMENSLAARRFVPPLAAAINDDSDRVAINAVRALANTGPEAAQGVPALIAALQHKNNSVRSNACDALGQIHAQPSFAVPALVAALKDGDNFVRFQAIGALQRFGSAASPAAVPLRESLEADTNVNVRWFAASALAAADPEGIVSLPALTKAVEDKDPHVRRFAAMGLGKLGARAKMATPLLLVGLKDKDPGARIAAAEALWLVDGNAEAAVPILTRFVVRSENPHVCRWAIDALGTIGPESKEAVPALRKLLTEESIRTLGKIGPAAADAAPELVELLGDPDASVAVAAACALWKISEHPQAVPTVVKTLSDYDGQYFEAIVAAGEIGPAAKEARPYLEKALTNPALHVREEAAKALKRIVD
jgi:HEAT repeat protein